MPPWAVAQHLREVHHIRQTQPHVGMLEEQQACERKRVMSQSVTWPNLAISLILLDRRDNLLVVLPFVNAGYAHAQDEWHIQCPGVTDKSYVNLRQKQARLV